MHSFKTMLVLVIFLLSITLGQTQSNGINVMIHSIEQYTVNNTLKCDINLGLEIIDPSVYDRIWADLYVMLHPDLYNNVANTTVRLPASICSGNDKYSIAYTVLSDRFKLTFFKQTPGQAGTCNGVVSLIPNGGKLSAQPRSCKTLTIAQVDNCLGKYFVGPQHMPVYESIPGSSASKVEQPCSYEPQEPSGEGSGQFRIAQEDQPFEIFPNPVSNWLTIKNSPNAVVAILDAKGALVKKIMLEIDQRSLNVNLSGLPSGMYIIRSGTELKKFIKL